MEIANEFSLSVPLDRAWPLLTDLARVAPAMPGATVTAVEPDGIRAAMKVKVGPISVAYRVRVELVSQDEATHVAVLRASGREARGQGTVEATVTARLRPDGADQTAVALTTDLAVTGRVAQFGGGVMKEVADRLLRQFAARLEGQLGEPAEEAAQVEGPAAVTSEAPSPARAAPAEEEAVDLGRLAGAALVPSGPGISAFAGAFLGTFLGALLAALLLRKR